MIWYEFDQPDVPDFGSHYLKDVEEKVKAGGEEH
jgi:O-methyltransferase involved in polyketide biosynthesis